MKTHAKKCNPENCTCDGYHTFAELYDHRIQLWITLCSSLDTMNTALESVKAPIPLIEIWRSKLHHDGTSFDGWFILGMYKEKGKQISYHLPLHRWDDTDFAETLEKAPEWDGHTSDDVLARIKNQI